MENTEIILKGKKVGFLSLGCKVNAYETEQFKVMFRQNGAEIVDFEAKNSDLVIINTCSVTNIADRKSRQMLHRARKLSPDAIVIAVGCYSEAQGQKPVEDGDADISLGNAHKDRLLEEAAKALARREEETKAAGEISEEGMTGKTGPEEPEKDSSATGESAKDNPATEKTVNDNSVTAEPAKDKSATAEPVTVQRKNTAGDSEDEGHTLQDRTRAFVKVEDGCNQFCTYCIIPYVRGRVRSRNIENVVGEIRELAASGYKEVVLTGIHLSSFGVENYEKASSGGFDGEPLLNLIGAVNEIDGIERIRLGSLEPRIITEDFCRRLTGFSKVCPHFHLSLQSGSDTVLKRMKRHYSTKDFQDAVDILRRFYEQVSVNTDIIVGFPGETDEEFEETIRFARKIAFAKMHIFKYSRRKGTVADKLPGQLDESLKHKRAEALAAVDDENREAYISGFVGRKVKVLFEQPETIDGIPYMTGLTERYVKVAVKAGIYTSGDSNSISNAAGDTGADPVEPACTAEKAKAQPKGDAAAQPLVSEALCNRICEVNITGTLPGGILTGQITQEIIPV